MSSATKRIDELGDAEITSSTELRDFTLKVRDLCRDLSWHLAYQSECLEAALSTLPTATGRFGALSSRVRAKTVAGCYKVAAEAIQHAAKLAVKSWALFGRHFAPELELARTKKKPAFRIDAA